ncbi:MAG: cation diffusion facilitator family transporter [Sphingomonadaceae bacterium]|nr:cation diffusion facilitator family transporter [Sphingomonadaceae bacterium]
MAHAHPHAHAHAHGHAHHRHAHAPQNFDRAFLVGIGLNLALVVAQVVWGVRANSLGLLADAGHNASDVLALALAWCATWLARRPPTPRFTYGFRRSSILAGLANAGLLLIATGMIAWESVLRLRAPEAIVPLPVIVVAGAGIIINSVSALLFARGSGDLNVRAAFQHLLADAMLSAAVLAGAGLTWATGWSWVDPAVALLIAAVIVRSSWSLLSEAVQLSLDAVPSGVDRAAVERFLGGLEGVSQVHDLHIWPMSTTEVALTAHLVRPGAPGDDRFCADAARALAHNFGIAHATLQIEHGASEHGCGQGC